jgi:hypothetical protein
MSGYTTVPFTIAYANELVTDPIGFVPYAGAPRLAYLQSRPGDWVRGVLRARVRDLRDLPDRRGPERMRKLNTRRQWLCMGRRLCQVCGGPATDPETGLIPWPLASTVFERTGPDSGRTNAPPTCWDCIPKALAECPMLRQDFALYTVAAVESAGVLADKYRPGAGRTVIPTDRNVFVGWDWREHHARALAVAHVVELRGMKRVA